MRGHFRRAQREEEEESAFVSMTDMTVSFLFIVILLLAFFASQFKEDNTVARSVFDRVAEERDHLNKANEILAEQLARTEKELEHAESEVQRLHALVDDLRKQLREASDALQQAESRIKELDDKLAKAENDLRESRAEVERLKKEIARLENELERVKKPDPLEEYMVRAANERRKILERLRKDLLAEFSELEDVLTIENDALRFQGDGLFRTNSFILQERPRGFLEAIAARLDDILPCYTLGERAEWDESCNAGLAIIEAVQIEGHTDDVGSDHSNMLLAGRRAVSSYIAMTDHRPNLDDHLNYNNEPVLSVSAYGENRPVTSNGTEKGKATNRRIDLRFIMFSPTNNKQIDEIRRKLINPVRGEAGIDTR